MTDENPQYRREYLHSISTGLATLTVASLAPTTTPPITGWSEPDDAVAHSGDRYSWLVTVRGATADDRRENLAALEDVLEGYDDTFEIDSRRHDAAGQTTLVAPPSDIGARQRDRVLDSGLATLSYVDSIELNRTVSLADPIDPAGVGAWSDPGRVSATVLRAFGDGVPDPDGVAFDADMEHSYLRAAREATDATDSDLGGLPDTSDVTVSISDTGVSDAVWLEDADGNTRLLESSTDFVSSGDPSGVGETTDENGHGDWVAACYAARDPQDSRRDGYLPDARVLACKTLDDDGQGTLSDIAASIRHSADENADIINLSLGSPLYSQAIEDALAYAVEEGVIPIAAAGNDRQLTRWLGYPASSDYTIAVGATTVADPADATSAYYSNVGPHNGYTDDSGGATEDAMPDVGAPGCELETATGEALTGTSMAAPVTGGVVGLGLASGGPDDLETVRDRLETTAEPVPKAAPEEVGHGMPSAYNLITDSEPDEDQADAMTDEAAARGGAYRSLSGSRFRRATAWFR